MAQYGDIDLNRTALFVCDMQEKFRAAIEYFDEIALIINRLTAASKILNIPLIVTEQYPQGLGKTVPEIDIGHAVGVYPKTKFSMVIPEIDLKSKPIDHVILCGIETHVCIQQTVIDLLKAGYTVHVVADGVSSRNQTDRLMAIERFRQMGAFVTTCEAVLLQLVGDKDHPHFKAVQGLIKVLPPDTKLIHKL